MFDQQQSKYQHAADKQYDGDVIMPAYTTQHKDNIYTYVYSYVLFDVKTDD